MSRSKTPETGSVERKGKSLSVAAKRAAAGLAIFGSALSLGACSTTEAAPVETATQPAATAEATTPAQNPTEVTTTPEANETTETGSFETLPNGEAFINPAELVELRAEGGDQAVVDYFTPTFDKLGITYDEALANPEEFSEKMVDFTAGALQLYANVPSGVIDVTEITNSDIRASLEAQIVSDWSALIPVDLGLNEHLGNLIEFSAARTTLSSFAIGKDNGYRIKIENFEGESALESFQQLGDDINLTARTILTDNSELDSYTGGSDFAAVEQETVFYVNVTLNPETQTIEVK